MSVKIDVAPSEGRKADVVLRERGTGAVLSTWVLGEGESTTIDVNDDAEVVVTERPTGVRTGP